MQEFIESFRQIILEQEAQIRLVIFLIIFSTMALWEIMAPRRKLTQKKSLRWLNNIALTVINSVVIRLIFPAAAVGMAVIVEKEQWGLLNGIALPPVLEIVIGILLLDLAIYGQHVMVHYVPFLWRFHKVHHLDLDLDVTSGARFHPLEIVFSMGLKFLFIFLLGPSIVAVFIFEVILNGASVFNHSNIRIPVMIDKVLRLFIVTPDMHRVHHSVIVAETNSNFGFNFPWWDRLFRTYNSQPTHGHDAMTIGLTETRKSNYCIRLDGLLKVPFIKIKQ